MASSPSQQHLVRLHQMLYLPALSLVLLTGFTFSSTLPSTLHALIPAMESLFFVSLPHLWKSFLSWITPPCLFVLLNGIIVILTATSGSFSRPASSSSSGGPDSYSNLQKQSADLEHIVAILAEPQAVDHTPLAIDPPSQVLQLEGPTVSQSGNIGIPSTDIFLHAEDAVEELPKEVSSNGCGGNVERQMISLEVPERMAKIVEQHEIDGDDTSCSSYEKVVKGGSEPSSPYFSSSPASNKNNIRRSFSIDSASFIDNEAPPEYLSDDEFKKRIEDFIFKVNSKIRSETTLIG